MPLSADNVIQEATGTTSPVTLPSGTTAGNTVIVVKADAGTATPTGFTRVTTTATQVSASVHYKNDVAAAENSWAVSLTAAGRWYAFEVSGVNLVDTVDVAVANTNGGIGNGATASTGTTALNSGVYTMALAVFVTGNAAAASSSVAGWSNGFAEVSNVDPVSTTSYGLAVARLFESTTTRTFTTATTLTSTGTATVDGILAVFRAVDSPIVAPLSGLLGFEWGTHGGGGTGGSTSMFGGGLAPTGTWGTSYLIQAGSARNSTYGLRIAAAGAAANVKAGSMNSPSVTFGMNVRVVSATGTVIVSTLPGLLLVYDSAATKFGVQCTTTGTVSWQSGTTALNTWVWVDGRMKVNTTTYHADWRIETGTDTYTDQASAEQTGQTAGNNAVTLTLGSTAVQTMTADYDDVVVSTFYGAYPLGPHQVKLLVVDPAGTPTVSGTTTNFSVFTANGTLAAWNAANARNALDDVPVTVSAAADGVVQTAVGASDYMEFPMADYTLAANEYVNGVRMLAPLWSGTGAGAGDLAIRGYDGTTETALATVSQLTPGSPTAIASGAPVWRTAVWQHANGWTQALLNALALRVGFSGDATPDMGVSALYLEVAIGRTRPGTGIGDYAAAQVDPTRLGLMSVTVTPPASTGLTLRWTDKNGSGTQYTAALGTFTQQFDSASAADVTVIEVESDPELPNRE